MPAILFHRDFQAFTGGHFKVWHYFNHVAAAPNYQAQIYFSAASRWDGTNPWLPLRATVLPQWQPEQADALFLGGHDWQMLPAHERNRYPRPVFNLVQHVRHGDLADPLAGFLRHRAIRLCVSEEVHAAIEARGVEGPVFTIPNGLDFADLPPAASPAERAVDWLICGLKDDRSAVARELARRVADEPGWGRVETLTKLVPRADFLAALAGARAAVLLPRAAEGFYLPALEAMALGTLVVCPDCVGNRAFCRDGDTALVPAACDAASLLAAMRAARALVPGTRDAILARAGAEAAAHTLARERARFHELLAAAPALW